MLVDRIWPRGVSKSDAALDEWTKDLAPSDDLRKWFGHDPSRFEEFAKRYRRELSGRKDELSRLRKQAKGDRLTLLFAAKDTEHNNAVVLADVIRRGLR